MGFQLNFCDSALISQYNIPIMKYYQSLHLQMLYDVELDNYDWYIIITYSFPKCCHY